MWEVPSLKEVKALKGEFPCSRHVDLVGCLNVCFSAGFDFARREAEPLVDSS